MILIVTYDLNGPAGSRRAFFEALKSQGNWWHYLSSTWLISTTNTPQQVFEGLKTHIRPGDRVLIARMGDYWGTLPKEAWDWIRRYEK